VSWLGKTAKPLFYFIFLFFSFLFLFGLTTQERSMKKYYMTMLYITVMCQDVIRSHHMMISHDKCGKVVYRPCSSCISSVQNQIGTLLSPLCQLRLGVWLSYLRLSHCNQCHIQTLKTLYLHGILLPWGLFIAKRSILKRASWWSLK